MEPIQPVSVAGIEFDALIDSEESHEATVPEYPVENGYSVSDNIAISALELSMTLYLTATPVTWLSRHGSGEDRLQSIPNQLLAIYREREPITVVTQDKTYTNMAIKSISISRSADAGVAIEIPVTFQQVDVTSSEKVDIPANLPHSGTTKTNTGTASTGSAAQSSSSESSSGSSSSSSGSSGGSSSSGSGGSSGSSGSTLHKLFGNYTYGG